MQNFRQLVDFVVSGNLHTKFHALLICLGFDARDDMLSNEEEKKLLRAQHYLDDKDATLWRAFSRELGEEVRAYACGRLFVCARALDCRLGVDATQRISLQAWEYRELTLAWTPACCRASVQ